MAEPKQLECRPSLLSPYPQFSGISYFTYDGASWYDALNMKFEKRFSHGYLVAATYTLSKFLAATNLLNEGDTTPAKYLSGQDYPHHLAISTVYELPVGRNRHFLSGMKAVPQAMFGGWNLSYIYCSGSPGKMATSCVPVLENVAALSKNSWSS